MRRAAGATSPLLAIVAAIVLGLTGPAEAQSYSLRLPGVTSGGGQMSSASFSMRATVGHPAVGASASASFQVISGGTPPIPSDEPTCNGDTNGDGVVDVLDLVAVILAWGTDDAAADVNDDGTVNVSDLVGVILVWGPCP